MVKNKILKAITGAPDKIEYWDEETGYFKSITYGNNTYYPLPTNGEEG